MPADEEKTTVEVKESAEVEKKKGGNKLILFGGIGLAVVVLVVLVLFVVMPMMSDSGEEAAAQESSEELKDPEKHAEKERPKAKKTKSGESEAFVYAIKDIVINPAGTGGSRFLSVSFGFELESSELVMEFEKRELLVRDALITIMSSKTVAQLTDAKQKEITRLQIKKRLSKLLDTENLAAVYYTDFVLQ